MFDILRQAPPEVLQKVTRELSTASISEKIARLTQKRIDAYNETEGELDGLNCPICKNKGWIAALKDGEEIMQECSCMPIRRGLDNAARSGLFDMIGAYNFDTYQTDEPWQKGIKQSAVQYAENPQGWWYIGGSVGSGKTHICTAICDKLMDKGIPVRYLLWREEIVKLKGMVNDYGYEEEVRKYKEIRCLYIDDFLKAGGSKVTDADLNIAFEILNHRYNCKNAITIISSEKTLDEVLMLDEAVGSRIYQKSKDHNFALSGNKNWRLR